MGSVNTITSQRRMIVYIVVFVVMSKGMSYVNAAENTLIPVTMSLDGIRHLTSFCIECKAEDFKGVKLQSMPSETTNEAAKDANKLFSSITTGDKNAFRGMKRKWSLDNGTRLKEEKLAERNLKGYRKLTQMYDEQCQGLKFYSDIKLGNGGMVIWGIDKNNTKMNSFVHRRAIRYEKTSQGELSWHCAVEAPDLFESIITVSFEAIANNPIAYNAILKTDKQHTYKIAIPGTEGANPAYFLFSGRVCGGIDIINEEVSSSDELLSFLQEAYLVWIHDTREEFATYYTHKSQERITKAIMTDRSLFDAYKEPILKGKKVLFILDADPLYVVFFRLGNYPIVQSEYIVKDPVDGKLKLTNLGVGDFTSQYFNSEAFEAVLNKIDSRLFPISK